MVNVTPILLIIIYTPLMWGVSDAVHGYYQAGLTGAISGYLNAYQGWKLWFVMFVGGSLLISVIGTMFFEILFLLINNARFPAFINFIAKHNVLGLRKEAIKNPCCNEDILLSVPEKELYAAIKHPRCPVSVIERYHKLFGNKNVEFKTGGNYFIEDKVHACIIAFEVDQMNLNEMLGYLKKRNADYKVRKALVMHPKCPLNLVNHLLINDPDFLVRRACLMRLGWPYEETKYVAENDPCEDLRIAAARRIQTI